MSSVSSSSKISLKSTSCSSLGSTILKSKFIWRFPPSKFDYLPSCSIERLLTYDIQPLTNDNELIQRQDLALLIYELALHINVTFTCVYTGVVYMHRFFMLHPFQQCAKEIVAAACLFLACKVNEIPRPLNEFTRHLCQLLKQRNHHIQSAFITRDNILPEILSTYNQQIIDYENMLLSTLGFCLNVDQPYQIITKTAQTLALPMEISQKAYEIATKSIFFTRFSLKYTTNLLACFALHFALKSSQFNVSENIDGSQWFHLLNEEFTEKLLQELTDEYQVICEEKCSRLFQERFEQLRQQKVNGLQSKSNGAISFDPCSESQHHPIATTSGSVRSTMPTIPQQQSNFYEQGSMEILHHTPNRSSLINISHNTSSPTTIFQSPQENSTSFLGPHHSNNSLIPQSSAKPIPTLMSSNSYYNSLGSRHHSRFSGPIFEYPSPSSTQRVYHPPLPQHYPQPYPSYYSQQQTPLFYHPPQDSLNLHNKRYGEPPAPPMKRFRYSLNPAQQHY
ncbi:hypothetical protein I4U23_006190 [Adineta vaga]|nr:hypothetical protein I4U23_006190 [Adineta vaga]